MVVPFRDRTEAGWLLAIPCATHANFNIRKLPQADTTNSKSGVDEIICVENNF
jgi:hypothetical protein